MPPTLASQFARTAHGAKVAGSVAGDAVLSSTRAGLLTLGLVSAVSAQEASPPLSFPSSTSAITVDVVVLGKDGRPVRGLGADDFTVFEDGHPQAIVAFQARDMLVARAEPPVAPAGAVVSNEGAASGRGRVLAFVIDDLGSEPRACVGLL
jgi:hypothetical protein